jgi:hypothetical protein
LVDEEVMDELLTPEELPAGRLAESLDNSQRYAEAGRRWVMNARNAKQALELFENSTPRPTGTTAPPRRRRAL